MKQAIYLFIGIFLFINSVHSQTNSHQNLLQYANSGSIQNTTALPDSVITALENGGFRKHFYQYNNAKLVSEERIELWEDDSPTEVHRTTYSYDPNNNAALLFTEELNGADWLNSEKKEMTYDAHGNRLTEQTQLWQNGIWVNSLRTTYEYNNRNERTVTFNEEWVNGAWRPIVRYTSEYDENGNEISKTTEEREADVLIKVLRYEYTYDSNRNKLTSAELNWNGSEWYITVKFTYEYNGENRLTYRLFEVIGEDDTLHYQRRMQTFYYDGGLLDSTFNSDWNGSGWTLTWRSVTQYNSNRDKLTTFTENLINTNWQNGTKAVYTYDSNGKLIGTVNQYWQGGQWINLERYMAEYDEEGNNTYKSIQLWLNGQWTPIDVLLEILITNNYRYEYYAAEINSYYGDTVTDIGGGDKLPAEFNLSQNYPNPFNPETTINYTVSAPGAVSLKVYNLLGKEVATLVNENKSTGSYSITWDAAGFSSGVYFYTLNAGNLAETKKMVLMK